MADLYNQPIVIDNGSGNIKAGFAGEEKPKSHVSAVIGTPKYQKIMASSIGDGFKDTFIGNSAQEYRGLLRLRYPVEHGVVNNWNDMEALWSHVYGDLKTNAEDHPLLITEAPLNPRSNRDKMCQVLFELMNVPCVYVSLQATLALYASGRTTGVVVDSGDGVTHIVPTYEGFGLPTAIKRMDIAGRDVTEQLSHHIHRMSGLAFRSSSEFEIVRDIKEKHCFVLKDPEKDEKMYAAALYTRSVPLELSLIANYRLPDGHVVQLGSERFRAGEILFNPQLIGEESPGVAQLTALALAKTDLDLRPTLYSSIILSGGNTLLQGFGDRMVSELKEQQIPRKLVLSSEYDTKMKVKIYAFPDRKFSTWVGGSILAGLSTFKKMWVTLQEYQEDPDIVHKKCI